MNAGRIEQVGPPLELNDTPKALFVAGFIGSPSTSSVWGQFGSAIVPLSKRKRVWSGDVRLTPRRVFWTDALGSGIHAGSGLPMGDGPEAVQMDGDS